MELKENFLIDPHLMHRNVGNHVVVVGVAISVKDLTRSPVSKSSVSNARRTEVKQSDVGYLVKHHEVQSDESG
jgi:hypothetical protein